MPSSIRGDAALIVTLRARHEFPLAVPPIQHARENTGFLGARFDANQDEKRA
jgi:hypothetical protein